MSTRESLAIYHLCRLDGSSLFLHPFTTPSKLISSLERYELEGKYGQEPKVESLTQLRTDLYRMIEDGVRMWVSNIRFIPKLLISSAVVLAIFLLFLFIFNNALPAAVEFLFGLAAGTGVYHLFGRKDMHSDLVLRKRIALRAKVDHIVFSESTFIREVEAALHEAESGNAAEILEALVNSPGRTLLSESGMVDTRRILSYLERRFRSAELRRREHFVEKLTRANPDTRGKMFASFRSGFQKSDLALFILYSRMKSEVEHVG